MNIFAKEMADTFLYITRSVFQNDFSNAQKVKLCWHHLNYISLSILNYKQIFYGKPMKSSEIDYILNEMQALGLLSDSTICFYRNYETDIKGSIETVLCKTKQNINSLDLSLFHEYLLCFDLQISPSKIDVNVGKNGKDIAGAYYTPTTLAQAVVNEAFGKYEVDCLKSLDKRQSKQCDLSLLSVYQDISIADLSCGGGEFFRAAQQYLLENHGIPYNKSCKYFWGFDVDPIALQITVCGLLASANRKDWDTIIRHFILGNPLVHTDVEASYSDKCSLFALNRIYARGMGINFGVHFADMRFDIVIGNPPWEKIRFEERKFFANLCPEISAIPQKDKRKVAISKLETKWPVVHTWAAQTFNDYSEMSSKTYRHPKIEETAVGELNTYALFTELAFELTKPFGVCALIVKSAIVTSPVNKRFWNMLNSGGFVHSVCLFDNKLKLFKIDSREKFCVITLSHQSADMFEFSAGILTAHEMIGNMRSKISLDDVVTVNPFTGMIPNVSHTEDMQALVDVHRRLPLFENVYPDCHFGRLIHLTAHATYIDTMASCNNVPVWEGKFIEQYDARFSTFESLDDTRKYASKASALKIIDIGKGKPLPDSRYFVQNSLWEKYLQQYPEKYSLCWRSLTSSTNARTTLAMILPTCPTCQSIQMLQLKNEKRLLLLLGLLNSIPFDYFVRLKMPGIDLTQSVIRQIPVPPEETYTQRICYQGQAATLEQHIYSRLYFVLRDEPLVKTLLDHIAYPVAITEVECNSKSQLRKELDYLFAKAYGINEVIFADMLETFPKYK